VLHAVWNAMAKHVDDQLFGCACIGVATTVGGVAVLLATGFPAGAALAYVAISALIHVAYEFGLMSSYRLGAFNQTYPIARGVSPLVVATGAWWLAGEHLGLLAWVGIVTLAAGLVSLALSGGHLGREDRPAVVAALLTGLTIAAYTLVDVLGVLKERFGTRRLAAAALVAAGILLISA